MDFAWVQQVCQLKIGMDFAGVQQVCHFECWHGPCLREKQVE
jgi:hypothetical protein